MEEIFLNEKPVKALVVIRRSRDEIYGSVVSRKIDTTYAHTVKIISQLEDEGLIQSEKKGRKKILTLTDKGERYADLFIEMLNLFEEDSNSMTGDPIQEEASTRLGDNDYRSK